MLESEIFRRIYDGTLPPNILASIQRGWEWLVKPPAYIDWQDCEFPYEATPGQLLEGVAELNRIEKEKDTRVQPLAWTGQLERPSMEPITATCGPRYQFDGTEWKLAYSAKWVDPRDRVGGTPTFSNNVMRLPLIRL